MTIDPDELYDFVDTDFEADRAAVDPKSPSVLYLMLSHYGAWLVAIYEAVRDGQTNRALGLIDMMGEDILEQRKEFLQ